MTRLIPTTCYASAGAAIWGVVSQNDALTWSAAGLAIASAVVTAAIQFYRRIRVAIREEATAERTAAVLVHQAEQTDTRALIRSLEDRIEHVVPQRDQLLSENARLTSEIAELKAFLQRVECRHPQTDGSAKCSHEDN